jgi:hypothetical protein
MSNSKKYRAERSAKFLADNPAFAAEIEAAHRAGYTEGCQVTMLSAYLAIQDYGLPGVEWLTDRIRAAAKKLPPPNTAIDEAVTHAVIEHMRGYDPKRAMVIEAEFATFLTK